MHHERGGGLARDRSRAWRAIARTLGVLGIAIGVALVALVLVGRGHAHARVREVEATIDAGLAQGLPLLTAAQERVAAIGSRVDEVGEAVRERVAGSTTLALTREALLARTTAFAERYLELRAVYAQARERLVAVLGRLHTLERSLPAVRMPSGPVEVLAALDAEVRDVDVRMRELLGALTREGALAEGLEAQVGALRGRFGRVDQGLESIQARVQGLRSEVAHAADRVRRLITLTAVALGLLALYGAFLHLVLYRSGRGPRRGAEPAAAA